MFKSFVGALSATAALSSLALASDLPSRKTSPPAPSYTQPSAAAASAPAFSWDGFYVGAHAGYGFGDVSADNGAGSSLSLSPAGFLVGLHGGYNMVFMNSYLAGLELDADYTDFKKSGIETIVPAPPAPISAEYKDNYRGSLVGRLGYIIDDFLVYGLGGASYHNAKMTDTNGFSDSLSKVGFTLGAGAEYAFTQNWIGRAEYRYNDFGTKDSIKVHDQTITLGVSYKFDSSAPLTARY
jgi:outer membrane immunogenic protein